MKDFDKSPFNVVTPMSPSPADQPMGEVCPMVKPGKGALWSSVVTLVL